MSTTNSKQDRLHSDKLLVDGYRKHLSGAGALVVGGASHAPADIDADLQARVDARNAVTLARAALSGVVTADEATQQRTALIAEAVRQTALIRFAGQPDVLAEFGLKPKKVRRPLTAEQALDAVNKRRQTRKARKTLGKRQKAQVHGDPAPAAPAGTAPAPTPAPAPTAAPAAPTPALPTNTHG
jgi:hypothetical protein